MKFDLLPILDSLHKDLVKLGTPELRIFIEGDMYTFRISLTTRNEIYRTQFVVNKNIIDNDANFNRLNEKFREQFFKLRRYANFGY